MARPFKFSGLVEKYQQQRKGSQDSPGFTLCYQKYFQALKLIYSSTSSPKKAKYYSAFGSLSVAQQRELKI